jgi:predicted O-methyltransferase YrrM
LNNQYSTLTCVDSWDLHDPITPLSNQTEARFFANLPKSAHPKKCTIYKTTSDDFFEKIAPVARYNLIYVDGSHELPNIKRDIENSWKALAPGGIMWMDDYLGGADQITMKKCMDATLAQFAGQFDVIHQGYQLAIRKRYF